MNVSYFDLGPNAGEMMMSVFWYYRPEQTEVGRIPDFHGEVIGPCLLPRCSYSDFMSFTISCTCVAPSNS